MKGGGLPFVLALPGCIECLFPALVERNEQAVRMAKRVSFLHLICTASLVVGSGGTYAEHWSRYPSGRRAALASSTEAVCVSAIVGAVGGWYRGGKVGCEVQWRRTACGKLSSRVALEFRTKKKASCGVTRWGIFMAMTLWKEPRLGTNRTLHLLPTNHHLDHVAHARSTCTCAQAWIQVPRPKSSQG